MLSIQAMRGLPRLRAPGIVPCIIYFSGQGDPFNFHKMVLGVLACHRYVLANICLRKKRLDFFTG